MIGDRPWVLVCGDGAQMSLVRSGEADLVLTGPPYFSESTKALLMAPVREQTAWNTVCSEIKTTAQALEPVFREMARVLRPGGALVVQTKDLRYAGGLVPLASWHRELAEGTDLRLVTRVYWRKLFDWRTSAMEFRRQPVTGSFRTDDVEEFQVFAHPDGIERRGTPLEVTADGLSDLASPLWTLRAPGGAQTHPYQAPAAVLERFLELLTLPGDLVVDPFAGHATALCLAVRMGRRAAGTEIDPVRAETARRFLRRAAREAKRRAQPQGA